MTFPAYAQVTETSIDVVISAASPDPETNGVPALRQAILEPLSASQPRPVVMRI